MSWLFSILPQLKSHGKDRFLTSFQFSDNQPRRCACNLFSRQSFSPAICFPCCHIGKSTLLSLLSGLLEPEHGSILLYGQKLFQKGNGTIGYMLQHDHLFEWRTIEENVLLGPEIQKKKTPAKREAVLDMLKTYGLYKFKDAKPSQLSGGMRQRAALIRTLALEPELLLLDEPFSALDYQTRLTVGDDIGSIIKKEEKTAILVTHDLSEAVSLGNRVIVLSKRPGTVKCILEVHFPENLTPLERRNSPEFKDYFNIIWKELNDDE